MRGALRWAQGFWLLGLFLAGCSSTQPMSGTQPMGNTVAVDQPVPEIDGTNIDQQPMKLSAYRGQVVMLDFSGTW